MRLVALFLAAFAGGFSGAIVPGPFLTVTIDGVTRRGFKMAPLLVVGHAILEGLMVIALVFGLEKFLSNHTVTGTIGLVGGLVLVWMGYGMIQGAIRGAIALELSGPGKSSQTGPRAPSGLRRRPVLLGLVTSLVNPYWVLWWATAGVGYVVAAVTLGSAGVLAFYTGHILSDFAWYLLVGFGVAAGRKFFSTQVYRVIVSACGVFLIGLAVYFLWSGVRMLFL
ncbi:MAG: LysE family translocator [Firmicutes bacterium]|nr:LysE family translocator [Bacillota bacterium]